MSKIRSKLAITFALLLGFSLTDQSISSDGDSETHKKTRRSKVSSQKKKSGSETESRRKKSSGKKKCKKNRGDRLKKSSTAPVKFFEMTQTAGTLDFKKLDIDLISDSPDVDSLQTLNPPVLQGASRVSLEGFVTVSRATSDLPALIEAERLSGVTFTLGSDEVVETLRISAKAGKSDKGKKRRSKRTGKKLGEETVTSSSSQKRWSPTKRHRRKKGSRFEPRQKLKETLPVVLENRLALRTSMVRSASWSEKSPRVETKKPVVPTLPLGQEKPVVMLGEYMQQLIDEASAYTRSLLEKREEDQKSSPHIYSPSDQLWAFSDRQILDLPILLEEYYVRQEERLVGGLGLDRTPRQSVWKPTGYSPRSLPQLGASSSSDGLHISSERVAFYKKILRKAFPEFLMMLSDIQEIPSEHILSMSSSLDSD